MELVKKGYTVTITASGESGAGKTRLLAIIRADMEKRGLVASVVGVGEPEKLEIRQPETITEKRRAYLASMPEPECADLLGHLARLGFETGF